MRTSGALTLQVERPPDHRRIDRPVEVLPHRQRVGVVGDGGGGAAGGGVVDREAGASVPVHRLLGVEAELLADALDQQVLLGGDADDVEGAVRRGELAATRAPSKRPSSGCCMAKRSLRRNSSMRVVRLRFWRWSSIPSTTSGAPYVRTPETKRLGAIGSTCVQTTTASSCSGARRPSTTR